jgi:nicotinamide phosphoribosyltransferase
VWYPTTVATVSWNAKRVIKEYLAATSDDPDAQIAFKLHDFGARGVSSLESAALGGAAHLVNFRGSDTVAGVLAANRYYNETMAGYSIPAAEHSTITAWGQGREIQAYRNMLARFAKPGGLLAVVSDSYDLYNAVENLWGRELRREVIESGAVLVIRPDSGNPPEVVLRTAIALDKAFGHELNGKGYRVLKHVRIIQGDGINLRSIREILANLKMNGYAADNIAFGMGGALLQQVNRDTQRFAMKCSAIRIRGTWQDVFKHPATDPGKASKRGRVKTFINSEGEYAWGVTRPGWQDKALDTWHEAMRVVWENGELKIDDSLAVIRERADAALPPTNLIYLGDLEAA